MSGNRYPSRLSALALISTLLLGVSPPLCAEVDWEKATDEAFVDYRDGDFQQAESRLKQALEDAERFGEGDPRLYKSLDNLALIYYKEGELEKSEPLLVRSVTLQEKKYGKKSIEIVDSLHNLGLLYAGQDAGAVARVLRR